jgi:hypothetical protein
VLKDPRLSYPTSKQMSVTLAWSERRSRFALAMRRRVTNSCGVSPKTSVKRREK